MDDTNIEKFNPANPLGETPMEKIAAQEERIYGSSDTEEAAGEDSPLKKSLRHTPGAVLEPGMPVLVPAEYVIVSDYLVTLMPTPEKIASNVAQELSPSQEAINQSLIEMSRNLLERWGDDIALLKAKQDERRLHPEIGEQSIARAILEPQLTEGTIHLAKQEYDAFKERLERILHVSKQSHLEKDADIFQMMTMFLIGTGLVSKTSTPLPIGSDDFASLSPIQQMQHLTMNLIPDTQMSAELGLIGALFGANTLYQATWVALAQNPGAATVKKNAAFAKSYAKDIEKLVKGTKLDDFVMASCAKLNKAGDTKPIDAERLKEFIAIVKLVHLVSAISVIYWVETRHITAQEIADMISGKMKLPEKDIRLPLLDLIQQQLKIIPPKDKRRVLEGLFDYLDSKPKVDDLMEPGKVFESLCSFIPNIVQG